MSTHGDGFCIITWLWPEDAGAQIYHVASPKSVRRRPTQDAAKPASHLGQQDGSSSNLFFSTKMSVDDQHTQDSPGRGNTGQLYWHKSTSTLVDSQMLTLLKIIVHLSVICCLCRPARSYVVGAHGRPSCHPGIQRQVPIKAGVSVMMPEWSWTVFGQICSMFGVLFVVQKKHLMALGQASGISRFWRLLCYFLPSKH